MAKSFKEHERSTTKPPDSSSVKSTVSEFQGHPDQVLVWRHDEFVRMGFTEFVADFLAATRIDLHAMEALLKNGCEHNVACEILMGTMWCGDDDLWRFTDESSYLDERDPETQVEAESPATP